MGAENSALIAPFAVLAAAAVCILLLALWRVSHRFIAWLSMASLSAAAVLLLIVILSGQGGQIQGMIQIDGWAALLALLLCGAGGASVLVELGTERDMPAVGGYALILLAVIGALAAASATHLLALGLGMAILTIALSALLGLKAAWSYLIVHYAGLASLLLGAALLYGATGSLDAPTIAQALTRQEATGSSSLLGAMGTAFVLVGMAVPLGLVPFHGWLKRAYRSAWYPAPLLVSLLTPTSSLAAIGRMEGISDRAAPAALALAAVSMLWGYVSALRAHGVRDTLAGISTAQSGLLLLALIGVPSAGQTAAACLLVSSTAALACMWALVAYVEQQVTTPLQWSDLWGLGSQRPTIAAAASLCVFSLAALPPLAGSAAQSFALQNAIRAQEGALAGTILGGILLAGLCAITWAAALWIRPARRRFSARATPEIGMIAATAAAAAVAGGFFFEPLMNWVAWLVAH